MYNILSLFSAAIAKLAGNRATVMPKKRQVKSKDTHKEPNFRLLDNERLEDWLKKHTPDCYPRCYPEKGEMTYPDRYSNIKRALLPIHDEVEIGAMSAGATKWMKELIEVIKTIENPSERDRKLKQLSDSDPIVYLNNHGHAHVDKVIERISEILPFFENGHLDPYEGFLLLCAIQIHDIGIVFGRDGHERRCREILEKECKPFIKDNLERRVIEELALVHGGAFNGDPNTIGCLVPQRALNNKNIRNRLLAALLRFGDELADDSSRANRVGLEHGTIQEGSLIYHHYSQSLHTVRLDRENITGKIQLELYYEFDTNIATMKFKKNGIEKYLLDEIYDRTLKMERERRYCMRFLTPCFSLDKIKVEIIIQSANQKDPFKNDKIQYTLEECGYPIYPGTGRIKDFSADLRNGEEEMKHIKKEWGL